MRLEAHVVDDEIVVGLQVLEIKAQFFRDVLVGRGLVEARHGVPLPGDGGKVGVRDVDVTLAVLVDSRFGVGVPQIRPNPHVGTTDASRLEGAAGLIGHASDGDAVQFDLVLELDDVEVVLLEAAELEVLSLSSALGVLAVVGAQGPVSRSVGALDELQLGVDLLGVRVPVDGVAGLEVAVSDDLVAGGVGGDDADVVDDEIDVLGPVVHLPQDGALHVDGCSAVQIEGKDSEDEVPLSRLVRSQHLRPVGHGAGAEAVLVPVAGRLVVLVPEVHLGAAARGRALLVGIAGARPVLVELHPRPELVLAVLGRVRVLVGAVPDAPHVEPLA
mmetsp:Transcript_45366/g.83977  ORF Transcript_45366/g.83977 Transcript_45366/m.83977 type:complete len:330 (-) Transcript_45366:3166-4155(-)